MLKTLKESRFGFPNSVLSGFPCIAAGYSRINYFKERENVLEEKR
jgi:hypothetical protein